MEPRRSPLTHICTFIVDKRNLFFLLYAILLIFSAFSSGWVKVENDISAYLSKDTETRQGMDLMDKEYVTYGSAKVMVSNISLSDAYRIRDEIAAFPGVAETEFLPEYLRPGSEEAPKEGEELTIEEIRERWNDSSALFGVTFLYPKEDPRAEESLEALKAALSGWDLHVSSDLGDVRAKAVAEEMKPIIVVVAIDVVTVLLLTSETFGEVPVLLITFLSAALIHKGTNFLLGTISFVSNSVGIVLQLALSIDYAIILCNRFKGEREHTDTREAVILALRYSIPEITASSLTTVSGLLALLFMGFQLGRDLGISLTKAIIISLASVFTLMPGLLVLFSDLMMKTRHKLLIPRVSFIGRFAYATRKVVPPLFLAVAVAAYVISLQCPFVYGYTLLETPVKNERQITDEMIDATFGSDNPIAVNVPSHDYYKIRRTAELLETMPEVKSVVSLANTEAKKGYTVSQPLTAREFSEMADLDYSSAAMLYGMYAADKDEYGRIIGGLGNYRIPFMDIFEFLHDKIDEGYADPGSQERQDLDETYEKLLRARRQLRGKTYERILLYLDLPEEGEETFAFLDRLHGYVDPIFEEETREDPSLKVFVVGESGSQMDLKKQFETDNIVVTVVSMLFVLVILLFTFQSVGMPLLLIAVIKGAIVINFTVPALMHENLFFISFLIVTAIQMGANIDYAIVIGSRYVEFRKSMGRLESIVETVNIAFPTIITSGSILAVAGVAIGSFTSDGAIEGIGQCIGRGTVISMLLVLFVLPQILLLGDRIISKTSFTVSAPVRTREASGLIRVEGMIRGQIHGHVVGTVHGIVLGDVRATVISGDVRKLAENEGQDIGAYYDRSLAGEEPGAESGGRDPGEDHHEEKND